MDKYATPILTAEQMRACDRYAIKTLKVPSLQLMEQAAKALKKECLASGKSGLTVILAGKGNNGGDGYALARLLKNENKEVLVLAVGGLPTSKDARTMYEKLDKNLVYSVSEKGLAEAKKQIRRAQMVVDCMFGTGFHGKLDRTSAALSIAAREKYTIACDVPSGVDCNTGAACENAVRADVTVTFAAYKPFCFLQPGKQLAGKIVKASIGMPGQAIQAQKPYLFATDDRLLKQKLKPRGENTHKGSFGAVQLVCGSKKMTGAAVMAAKGALRSGVGLVYMASDKKTRRILQTHLCEPVFVNRTQKTKATAAVIGCGLGKKARVIKKYAKTDLPCVIDADALTYLSEKKHMHILHEFSCAVITPHPLEMARLIGKDVAAVEADRIGTARSFAAEYGVTVVLKGHHTVIASPSGLTYINTSGNSGLAKGGSGDVLAGVIGSLLAQGYPALDAAALGVYLHGKAADSLLKKGFSAAQMLPTDLPGEIGNLMK